MNQDKPKVVVTATATTVGPPVDIPEAMERIAKLQKERSDLRAQVIELKAKLESTPESITEALEMVVELRKERDIILKELRFQRDVNNKTHSAFSRLQVAREAIKQAALDVERLHNAAIGLDQLEIKFDGPE